jgi:hypothetical protein
VFEPAADDEASAAKALQEDKGEFANAKRMSGIRIDLREAMVGDSVA